MTDIQFNKAMRTELVKTTLELFEESVKQLYVARTTRMSKHERATALPEAQARYDRLYKAVHDTMLDALTPAEEKVL